MARSRCYSTLRIWSAACATGEEPLTIAIALNEAGWFERRIIEILASDASTKAIERAARVFIKSALFEICRRYCATAISSRRVQAGV